MVRYPRSGMPLLLTLSRTTPNQSPGPIISRTFGYMGLALYEAVVPGMPAYKSIQSQLNGMPALPQVVRGEKYFYPSCANAALANMVHHMFGNTSPAQNFTIDSLETSFNTSFTSIIPKNVLDRSLILAGIYQTLFIHGLIPMAEIRLTLIRFHQHMYHRQVRDYGFPNQVNVAQLPYWGNNRTFINNNAASTQPPPPPAYSIETFIKILPGRIRGI